MKIAVTGGAGFIGSNLCRYLRAEERVTDVCVIDDLSTGSRKNLDGIEVDFNHGTILSDNDLDGALKGCDSIVHLAAIPSVPRSVKSPRASHDANATGTLNVLEAARRNDIDHVVVASSSSVYGSNAKLPKNELDWTRPMSPYAVSKLATEAYALAYQSTYGINVVPFRFFNVYGPGQAADHAYAAVIPKFVDAALNNRPLRIEGDGLQSRDFTYVETVASVIWQAVREKMSVPQPVNLALGTNTTLLDLVDKLEVTLGYKLQREYTDHRIGDVRASQADPAMLLREFSEIVEVSLEDGLLRTIEWMRGSL